VLPDCPYDASELVRHRDRGLVVDMGLRQLIRPFPQPIRLLLSCVDEHGARTMDEQRPQVPVAALRDAAEIALEAARVLPGCETEIASEVSSRREPLNVADEADHRGRRQQSHARNRL
jgi:hypothetical protein